LTNGFVGVSVYNNSTLLTTNTGVPIASGTNPLYDAKVQFGLNTPEMTGLFGLSRENERFFHSSNGSNNTTAGGGLYLLLADGTLRQWNGNSASTSPIVANLGAAGISAYTNPTLLFSATLPIINPAVTVTPSAPSNSGGSITITPVPAFDRSVVVTASITDGLSQKISQTFTYTVAETAPVLPAISTNPSAVHGQSPAVIALGVTDADDSISSLSYTTTSSQYRNDLKVQFGLNTAEINGLYNYSALHGFPAAQEKFLASSNNSNPSAGNLFLITPDGNLRQWNNSSALTSPIVANVGLAVYLNPDLIYNASPAAPARPSMSTGAHYMTCASSSV
jgi:hypothetical protein